MAIAHSEGRALTGIVAAAWLGFIIYLALMPRLPQLPLVPVRSGPVLGHYGAHLVLAVLAYLLTTPGRASLLHRVRGAAMATALAIGTGVLIEVLQATATQEREAQLSDVLVDAAGGATGALMVFALDQLRVSQVLLRTAAAAGVVALMLLVGVSAMVWDPSYPRMGDHWHARYMVSVCGRVARPFPATEGAVHSHGGRSIHIHPYRPSEAGANANLGRFFLNSGGELTSTSLTLPSGQRYVNGDRCPDGRPGRVVVLVDGLPVQDPPSYVLRDGDVISISFEAEGE